MVICKYESFLQDHVIDNFNKYFAFAYAAREVKFLKNSEHRIDILGEDDQNLYIIELKVNKIYPRHLKQIRFYLEKYQEEINPAKAIKGIMAAPGCTLEAWKEIQQDPLLDLIILNDVYLRKKLNPVGRPALAADDKRKPHSVKMTDAEWQRIQEKAKAAGMSTSEWIRLKAGI